MMARAKPRSGEADGGWKAKLALIWYPREYLLAIAFLGALGLGGAWGTWQNLCAGDACPSIARISTFEHEQKSRIFAADGQQIAEFGFESRTPISIRALPDYVAQAVVATEDKRFYGHGGFDPVGFARAAVGVLTFNYAGGGSTITQQLARNLFEEIGFERRYTRKLKELQVAFDLERSYSKEQILEAYLNEIYMGNVYGFQAAAERYFGKNVADVNVAEAALLTAILNRPTRYNPFTYPEAARNRRNMVLQLMANQGYLTQSEADRWKEYPLPETEPDRASTQFAPYFEEWVRQILADRFGDEIYRGGFRVYTTLDVDMQQAARTAMEEGWLAIEEDGRFRHPQYAEFDTVPEFGGSTPYLQGAFIALDPETGHVKALIGGRDFRQSKFDRARQARRQAGSAFKPFVYTAAIASGLPPTYVVEDIPVVYPQLDGTDWRPSNFTDEFKGPMTIRNGLASSTNMIAIRLGWEEIGMESIAQTARRMGIQTEIERFPSSTIGAAEVIPIQIAEAYSAFPNLGTKVRPFPILRVEDDNGTVIWEPQPERTVVLDSVPARIMVDMLQDVVRRGTGWNAIRERAGLTYSVAAAGKTGTTNDGTDVWFSGFTPNLLATIWFGMDTPQPIFGTGAGGVATGGGQAAPVWGAFMKRVYQGVEADEDAGVEEAAPLLAIPDEWELIDGINPVLVDRETGLLASRWCPEDEQYIEYFMPGTEPTELCDRSSRRFRFPRVRGRD